MILLQFFSCKDFIILFTVLSDFPDASANFYRAYLHLISLFQLLRLESRITFVVVAVVYSFHIDFPAIDFISQSIFLLMRSSSRARSAELVSPNLFLSAIFVSPWFFIISIP